MDEEVSKGDLGDKSNEDDDLEVLESDELPSLHDILSTPKSVSDLFDEMVESGTTGSRNTTSAGRTMTGSNVKENDDAIDELLSTPPVSKTYSKRRKSENQNNQQQSSDRVNNLVVINLTPSRKKKFSKETDIESEINNGKCNF